MFQYGRRDGATPAGWACSKAIAGPRRDYGALQRGVARFGFELLLEARAHPAAEARRGQILAWRDRGRAIAAARPLSPRVPTSAGPLPRNHVFAVVGADADSGHVLLRNPVRPEQVLTLDARSFRRGFLSLDVTAPLR